MRAVVMAFSLVAVLTGGSVMAQNPEPPPGRELLSAGQGAVANANTPAVVTLDIGGMTIAPQARLALSLAPASSVDESYLVVVSIKAREGPPRRLGTVSFFPPRGGVAQDFYFDAAPLAAAAAARGGGRVELLVALVPAEQSQTVTSSVRVTGARLVGN
jgi:hypothetical protein